MKLYRYRWAFHLRPGMQMELEVEASSALVARRIVDRFVEQHQGSAWHVESVGRRGGGESAEGRLAEGFAWAATDEAGEHGAEPLRVATRPRVDAPSNSESFAG